MYYRGVLEDECILWGLRLNCIYTVFGFGYWSVKHKSSHLVSSPYVPFKPVPKCTWVLDVSLAVCTVVYVHLTSMRLQLPNNTERSLTPFSCSIITRVWNHLFTTLSLFLLFDTMSLRFLMPELYIHHHQSISLSLTRAHMDTLEGVHQQSGI